MKAIRIEEQKKAAHVGGYSVQFLLAHPSKAVKDREDGEHIAEELAGILRAARPRFVYMHNLADKHETHVATALKALAALRSLPEEERPEKLFGCEVWRDLDWMSDEEKVFLDTGAYPHLARALSGVFDSQDLGRQALRAGSGGAQARERDLFRKPCVRYIRGAELRDGPYAASARHIARPRRIRGGAHPPFRNGSAVDAA